MPRSSRLRLRLVEDTLRRLILERTEEWIALAAQRLGGGGSGEVPPVPLAVTPPLTAGGSRFGAGGDR